MTTLEITTDNLTENLAASRFLLDFYAPWCSACKTLGKVIDSIAAELPGDLVVGKVDVEKFPLLAAQYGVTNLPRLIFFRDGKLIGELSGVPSAGKLKELVNR